MSRSMQSHYAWAVGVFAVAMCASVVATAMPASRRLHSMSNRDPTAYTPLANAAPNAAPAASGHAGPDTRASNHRNAQQPSLDWTGPAPAAPILPAAATADLQGFCFSYDPFNCPGMYLGRSYASKAYFAFSSNLLREDDLISVDATPDVAYEQVYSHNLNSTHFQVRLLLLLSNETTVKCFRTIYAGQLLGADFIGKYGTFTGREWCGNDGTAVRQCDAWRVVVKPFYNDYTFLTHNNTIVQARANSGATVVNYYNFKAAPIASAILTPPAGAMTMECPLVGH